MPVSPAAVGLPAGADPVAHADLLVAYADTLQEDLDAGSPQPLGLTVEPELLRRELAATRAEAAAWMLTADARRGAALTAEAGRAFRRLGLGFGDLLLAATGEPGERQPDPALARRLHAETVPSTTAVAQDPAALLHRSQQLLALVATSTGPETVLAEICAESPHRDGPDPLGILGLPVHHYWSAADALLHHDASGVTEAYVVPVLRRRSQWQEDAMVNRWVWEHGSPPGPPVDLEVVVTVALTVHRVGLGAAASAMAAATGDMSPLAVAHVEIGVDVAQAQA